MIPKCFSRLP